MKHRHCFQALGTKAKALGRGRLSRKRKEVGVGRQIVLNRERRSDFPRLGRYSIHLGGSEDGGGREKDG